MSFEIPAGTTFADDLDVQLNPEDFQDPSLPLPIAGNFAFRIKKMDLKKVYGKDDIVLVDDKYPVLRISELELAGPEGFEGRSLYLPFQEFGTKPYFERDWNTGSQYQTNRLAQLIRSHDATLGYRDLQEGLALLQRLVDEGAVFHAQFDYLAEDRKWIGEQVKGIEAARDRGDISDEEAKAQLKEVRYKQGRKEGVRNFTVNGVVNPVFESPSGEEIEARTVIKKFISTLQLDRFKLGLRKELRPKSE